MKTRLFIASIIAIALAACNSKTVQTEATTEAEPAAEETLALDGTWRLLDFAHDTEICVIDEDSDYYLQFNSEDNSFGMSTECNSLSGNYVATADSLRFNITAATLMLCDDTKVEDAFKSILPTIDTYSIGPDSTLQLRVDARRYATFKFVPAE